MILLNNKPLSIQFSLIALDMETINSSILVQASRDNRELRAIKIVMREVEVEQGVVVCESVAPSLSRI